MTKKKTQPESKSKTLSGKSGLSSKTPRRPTDRAKQKTPTATKGSRPSFEKPKLRLSTGDAARQAQQEEAQRPLTIWGLLIRLLPVWALRLMILILEPALPIRAIGGLVRAVSGLGVRSPVVQQTAAEPVFIVEGAESRPPADIPTPAWDLSIASVFTPEVQYWADDIANWSLAYRIKPNLIATLIQIESCGNPSAVSAAGALGLFQVLPLHFAEGGDPLDPGTNARRGLTFFAEMYAQANGDLGLTFAAYNGGPGVLDLSPAEWPAETQAYQFWGSGIFEEAELGLRESPTLLDWLAAGGQGLCDQAAVSLGISSGDTGSSQP